MSGLIESASAIMSGAERRLEIAAQNVANVSTPGYKRLVAFAQLVRTGTRDPAALPQMQARVDDTQGKLTATGNPFDLAIGGPGYFAMRADDTILYARQGQFRRDADGTVVNELGHVLQQSGGVDLIVDAGKVEIRDDGTVVQNDRPVGRIAVFLPSPGASAPDLNGRSEGSMEEALAPLLRSGMVESSNVSTADEMTSVMSATRQAESGARLAQLYDELMGRALTSFGQGGR